MKQTILTIPPRFIKRININGLRGRMMVLPNATNKRHILLVYGHHSSLERMYSLASYLSAYATITAPDLPGFGGMDNFYLIGKKPTLDAMADYLATFIKLHYKKRRFVVCGMSYGFLVVTRMLQKYPEMAKQVSMNVSLVGFSDANDFSMRKGLYPTLRITSRIFRTNMLAFFAQHVLFSKPILYSSYKLSASRHPKMKDADKVEFKRRLAFEYYLWHCNHARTYFYTMHELLTIHIAVSKKIPLTLHHIHATSDQYFDATRVEAGLKRLYRRVKRYDVALGAHTPTVIADPQAAGQIIPSELAKKVQRLRS